MSWKRRSRVMKPSFTAASPKRISVVTALAAASSICSCGERAVAVEHLAEALARGASTARR